MTFNVLNAALSAIAPLGTNKTVQFYKYTGTIVDDMGRDIPQYADPVSYTGSLQPVSNRMYQQLGLDLNKNYRIFYCSTLIEGLAQNAHPDKMEYDGRTYETVENQVWHDTNGWTKAILCEVKVLRNGDSA